MCTSLLTGVWDLLTLGGEEATRILSLTQFLSDVVTVEAAVSSTTPRDFPHPLIKPPYCPF